jgi:hypothetical protein
MYVVFMWDGKSYRTELDTEAVEVLGEDGEWTKAIGGRILRTARMEREAWLSLVKQGDK